MTVAELIERLRSERPDDTVALRLGPMSTAPVEDVMREVLDVEDDQRGTVLLTVADAEIEHACQERSDQNKPRRRLM
jgi:hypothetical protein